MKTEKDDEKNDIQTFKFNNPLYRYITIGFIFIIIFILLYISRYF